MMTDDLRNELSRRQWLGTGLALTGGLLLRDRSFSAEGEKLRWVKSRNNPMISLGAPGSFDCQNIMSPCVVKDGKRYLMIFAGGALDKDKNGDWARYQLSLATSDDGEHWTKTGKTLFPLGERDDFHVTPALLRDPEGNLKKRDGIWHLIYCANRADDVDHATSHDGMTWEKDPKSPIFKKAYAPAILEVDGELRMYYTHKPPHPGKPRIPWEIHLATGKDIYSLKPHASNPVLSISQDWEAQVNIYPYVLREGKTWVMFYAAYWKDSPQKTTDTAIGMATSPDGVKWTKFAGNPVLTPTQGSKYDSRYCSSQCVFHDGDHYKMYYAARVDMEHKYYAIGLATLKGKLLDLVSPA